MCSKSNTNTPQRAGKSEKKMKWTKIGREMTRWSESCAKNCFVPKKEKKRASIEEEFGKVAAAADIA